MERFSLRPQTALAGKNACKGLSFDCSDYEWRAVTGWPDMHKTSGSVNVLYLG